MHGVLVVAKPAGPTSHDVVALVRRLAATRRIGHGGTLDPFASGVLPLFLGGATRLVEYHLADDKAYRATICFGATSTTDDLDGELTPVDGAGRRDRATVERGARGLPRRAAPAAARLLRRPGRRPARLRDGARGRGRRAAGSERRDQGARPRSSGTTRTRTRPIAIVDVRCSAGTYVRALARDLGAAARLRRLPRRRSCGPRAGRSRSTTPHRSTRSAMPPRRRARTAIRALLLPADTGLEALPAVALTASRDRGRAPGPFVRPAARAAATPRTTCRCGSSDAAGRDRGHGPARRRRASPRPRCCRADAPTAGAGLDGGRRRHRRARAVARPPVRRGRRVRRPAPRPRVPARELREAAPRHDARPAVITFDHHPDEILHRATRRRCCAIPTSGWSASRRPASP